MKIILASLAAALLVVQTASATLIYTPPLQGSTGGGGATWVCEIVNFNNFSIAPTVRLKDHLGAVIHSGLLAIGAYQHGNLPLVETTGTTFRYCEVDVPISNALADNLRVNLQLVDSTGETFSAVAGARVGSNNTPLLSSALSATPGPPYSTYRACMVVNTSTASVTVGIAVRNAAGSVITSTNVTIPSGQGNGTNIVASSTPTHCEVSGMGATEATKLRVSFVQIDASSGQTLTAVLAE